MNIELDEAYSWHDLCAYLKECKHSDIKDMKRLLNVEKRKYKRINCLYRIVQKISTLELKQVKEALRVKYA